MSTATYTWNPEELDAKEQADRRNAAIATAIIVALILLILFILGLYRQNPPPGEKGIAVIFGTTDQGSGDEAPSAITPEEERTPEEVTETEAQPETEVTPTPEAPVEEVVTQEFEEAPVVAPAKPKPTPEPTKPVETPKEPTKPVEKPKTEPTPKPGSTFGGFESDENKSGGKGDDQVPGDKGKPGGTGTNWEGEGSGTVPGGQGDGYGLAGRSPLRRIEPKAEKEVSGTVRIKITVNSQGKVISAVYSSDGSTTADSYLKQISIEAALKWEWTADPQKRPEQVGYIDFKYKKN